MGDTTVHDAANLPDSATLETTPIPGTTIFDGRQAMKGYALNKMCYSFNGAAARE